jgi:hypothetical protein
VSALSRPIPYVVSCFADHLDAYAVIGTAARMILIVEMADQGGRGDLQDRRHWRDWHTAPGVWQGMGRVDRSEAQVRLARPCRSQVVSWVPSRASSSSTDCLPVRMEVLSMSWEGEVVMSKVSLTRDRLGIHQLLHKPEPD